METRSSKRKKTMMKKSKKTESNEEDRISALPDALLHHIFSFMNMREVVHTSILSNRWRYVWMSTTTLNFDNDNFVCRLCTSDGIQDSCDLCWATRDAFVNFVERVLIVRESSNIFKFNLTSLTPEVSIDPVGVYTCIIAALARRVQQVILRLDSSQPIELPPHLFTSKLRVLHLDLDKSRLPNSICTAAHIKTLELRKVKIPDGNANGELILTCPVLENLIMSICDVSHLKILSISTPLLESLELCHLNTGSKTYNVCKLKTCTPNLKSIKISDGHHLMVDYCIENLPSLASADISISPGVYASPCLIKVLIGISHVQALKLSLYSLQVLQDASESLERILELFHYLKYVMLIDTYDQCATQDLDAILCFLERVPCIENLVWKRKKRSSAYKGEEWVANLPLRSIFHCLKTFDMLNFNGAEAEYKFLEFLLERAIVLKEMIIKSTTSCLLDNLTEKLLSMPRASSNASISCQLNHCCL